jgi:hypothetical protein
VTLLAVMLKSCLALITDELLNNSSDKLIFMSLSALIKAGFEACKKPAANNCR